MISEICANWIHNNISQINDLSVADIKLYLQDIEDYEVKQIILCNRSITFAGLCESLLKTKSDGEARAHLLGYESSEERQKELEEVYNLMGMIVGSSRKERKGE